VVRIESARARRPPTLRPNPDRPPVAPARANYDVGAMPHGVRNAIDEAGRVILSGRYHDQFVLVYTRAAPEHRRT